MSRYSEKFKDPRWQKKRLEILDRDGWGCVLCGDKDTTLNVHHKWYMDGKDPWEYEDNALVTLCQSCHEDEHANKREYESLLLATIYGRGLFVSDLIDLSFSFMNMEKDVICKIAAISKRRTENIK